MVTVWCGGAMEYLAMIRTSTVMSVTAGNVIRKACADLILFRVSLTHGALRGMIDRDDGRNINDLLLLLYIHNVFPQLLLTLGLCYHRSADMRYTSGSSSYPRPYPTPPSTRQPPHPYLISASHLLPNPPIPCSTQIPLLLSTSSTMPLSLASSARFPSSLYMTLTPNSHPSRCVTAS